MDPHYRTIEGFMQLVEKEWITFGHRFTQRSSQTEANKQSGFAPVFLLFLDSVFQLLRQFPCSFEFNDFYLRFLAFHHVSNRFNTFKLDSEADRVPWIFAGSTGSPEKFFDKSAWRFIEDYGACSPLFYNFLYRPTPKTDGDATLTDKNTALPLRVLRPATKLAALVSAVQPRCPRTFASALVASPTICL